MTTPDELREIVRYLQERVQLTNENGPEVSFDLPEIETMVADGLDESTLRRLTALPWWPEMIDDVIETPDFADPDETAETVLGYARDVVSEYIRKRFTPVG